MTENNLVVVGVTAIDTINTSSAIRGIDSISFKALRSDPILQVGALLSFESKARVVEVDDTGECVIYHLDMTVGSPDWLVNSLKEREASGWPSPFIQPAGGHLECSAMPMQSVNG